MDFFKKAASSLQGNSGNSDLMKQAEGLFSSGSTKPAETEVEKPAVPEGGEKGGYGEVYSSAQTLYKGLQDKMSGKTDVNDQELAAAAEDVVKAAESSGYIKEDTQYADYLKKAESYLHNYGAGKSDEKPKAPESLPAPTGLPEAEEKSAAPDAEEKSATVPATDAEEKPASVPVPDAEEKPASVPVSVPDAEEKPAAAS